MAVPVLSFFTGGGFFDLGFKQAGFSICWTNENNPAFIAGYEHGMSSWLSSLNEKRRRHAKISNSASIYDLAPKQVLEEAFSGPRPPPLGSSEALPVRTSATGGPMLEATAQTANSQAFLSICSVV